MHDPGRASAKKNQPTLFTIFIMSVCLTCNKFSYRASNWPERNQCRGCFAMASDGRPVVDMRQPNNGQTLATMTSVGRPSVPAGGQTLTPFNVKGLNCPICLNDFMENDLIAVLSCPGTHTMCKECYDMFEFMEREEDLSEGQEGARLKLNARIESADVCPCCKLFSHVVTMGIAKFERGDGSPDNPIEIVD